MEDVHHMTCYAFTNQGSREVNEDSVAVARSPFGAFCVLADGLGGHGMGDAASQLVCRCLKEQFGKWQGTGMEEFLKESFEAAQVCLTLEQVRLKALPMLPISSNRRLRAVSFMRSVRRLLMNTGNTSNRTRPLRGDSSLFIQRSLPWRIRYRYCAVCSRSTSFTMA